MILSNKLNVPIQWKQLLWNICQKDVNTFYQNFLNLLHDSQFLIIIKIRGWPRFQNLEDDGISFNEFPHIEQQTKYSSSF